MLDGSLGHAERQTAIDGRSEGYLVQEASVDAYHRNSAEVTRAMDGLAQDMRPVGPHEGGNFYSVHHGIEAGIGEWFRSDRIDACIRAAAFGQFLDLVVDVLV